ncbi:TPA: hypothetical protein ACGSTL_001408 [Vibrio parahaemolyticus]|uniref:hypothetical protein n=1 Tax=Vibrio campbellii TaxID=680 RepID=UPI001F0818BC|nr:hypothetical protein [Vibrio campbellii]UMM06853.1 hypothetical protein MKR81_26695 [Vibrio campbellii]
MASLVQRTLQKSLAKSAAVVQEETGMPMKEVVEIMNKKYGYVNVDDTNAVETLATQVELDAKAERHAKEHKVTVDKTAVATTALDRELKRLAQNIQDVEPQTE